MFASFAYQFMVECTKKKLEVIGGWEVGAATPLSPPPAKSVVVAIVFVIGLGIHSFAYSFICLFFLFAGG